MNDEIDAGKFETAGTQEGSVHPPQQHGQAAMPPSILSGGSTTFTYKMDHGKRGVLVLINNKNFHKNTGLEVREGTDIDAANLIQRFKELDFEVKHHHNKTRKEMMNIMFEAAQEDHSDSDCFACAILTHGAGVGRLYGTDAIIGIDTLVEPFKGHNCRSLLNKPKLFIIQACRGDRLDEGVIVEQADGNAADKDYIEQKSSKIPVEQDLLFAYSTVAGYKTWRSTSKGSWFITAFCRVLQKYGKEEEIMLLLTRTNHIVASEFETKFVEDQRQLGKKQMPQIVSMLSKQLFFVPKLSVLQTTEQLEAMSTK